MIYLGAPMRRRSAAPIFRCRTKDPLVSSGSPAWNRAPFLRQPKVPSTDVVQVHQMLLPRLYKYLICRMKTMERSENLPGLPRVELIVIAGSLLASVHP